MTCLDELTYHLYLDGELATEEARGVEAHLAACPGCRQLVAELRRENLALVEALTALEPVSVAAPSPAPRLRWLDLAWTTAAVLGAAVGLQAAVNWVTNISDVEGTEWLNPLNLAVVVNLSLNGFFYLLREGASMLISAVEAVSALVLAAAVLGGGFVLIRRRMHSLAVLMSLVLLAGLAAPASATDMRKGGKTETVVIARDEVVNDTLIVHAHKVVVDGTVAGNVLAFAEGVEVNGIVKGDLFAFAGGVKLTGTVEGNLIVFTGGLDMEGRAGQSAFTFSGGVNLHPNAKVGGSLYAFAGGVNAEGEVQQDMTAFAGGINLTGTVGRNLHAFTDKLRVATSGRIGGDLRAHVSKPGAAVVDPSATIGGKQEIKIAQPEASPYLQPRFYSQNGVGLGISFLIGWLLLWALPALAPKMPRTGGEAAWSAFLGFLYCVATPAAAVILGVVLLGIGVLSHAVPIALLVPFIVFLFWGLSLYVAKVFVSLLLGRAMLSAPPDRLALPMLVGLLIYYVVSNLPYIGGLIRLLVAIAGLGLAVTAVNEAYKRGTAAA